MTAFDDLKAKRNIAGIRYQKALIELFSAYVDLGALDGALNNKNIGGSDEDRSFGFNLDHLRATLCSHPLAPDLGPTPLSHMMETARDEYIARVRSA